MDQAPSRETARGASDETRERAEALARYLNAPTFWGRTPTRTARLTVTRNRVTLISVRPDRGSGTDHVRAHEAFLRAPESVWRALRRFLRRRRRADWRTVADFARALPPNETTGAPRPTRRRSPPPAQGRVYDLAALRDEVNAEFFGGRIVCAVGWSRSRARRRSGHRVRTIRYGAWDVEARQVRVHPLLDDATVPREFVKYIVFHEMLHADTPAVREGGRRYVHTALFRVMERRYPDHHRMRLLARELVRRLD